MSGDPKTIDKSHSGWRVTLSADAKHRVFFGLWIPPGNSLILRAALVASEALILLWVPIREPVRTSRLLFAACPPELGPVPVDQGDAIFPDHRDSLAFHRWNWMRHVALKSSECRDLLFRINRPLRSEKVFLWHVRELATAKASS